MIGAAGLFAPTIRYLKGTFYIFCTNVGCEGAAFEAENFYITTSDIWANEWSDKIAIHFRGIDPSLFIDDDDRAYVQGSLRLDRTEQPTSMICQFEIDLKSGKPLSDVKEIWGGHSKIYSEGPHVYKKEGMYYLLIAEGGTFEHHHLSIARAANIWGPYESCDANPILGSFGKDELVQDAGHGELFQDARGGWWATVLGVRKYSGRYPLGRESWLAPVEWPQGGWPSILHPQLNFYRAPAGTATLKMHPLISHDPFAQFCHIRNPVEEDYRWSDDRRSLVLRASQQDLSAPTGTTTFIGKRQRSLDSIASTIVHYNDAFMDHDLRAGLIIYKDDFRYSGILLDFKCGNLIAILRNNSDADVVLARRPQLTRSVCLRIVASCESYTFQYRLSGLWETLATIDTLEMTCRDFTGTIFGLTALQRKGSGEACEVLFDARRFPDLRLRESRRCRQMFKTHGFSDVVAGLLPLRLGAYQAHPYFPDTVFSPQSNTRQSLQATEKQK